MIIVGLTEAERAHLAVALADRGRVLRRNGQQLPPRLLELADSLMRPDPARPGQDYGRGAPRPDDGPAGPFPALLNAAEAAGLLGISRRSLDRSAASGVLPSVLMNGHRKFRSGDLEKYVAALPPGKRAG